MNRFQTHDIVRSDPAGIGTALVPEDRACLEMVEVRLQRAPFVVVRRAVSKNGMVPVGVRGEERSQRFAAWLTPDGACERITPESLRISGAVRDVAAFAALHELQQRWCSSDYLWGPTGSVGFELASGMMAVSASSDLDLVLRSDDRLSYNSLRAIADTSAGLACVVDIQMETPHGGFALQEYLNTGGRVLLRTGRGPVLVEDPWSVPDPEEMLP